MSNLLRLTLVLASAAWLSGCNAGLAALVGASTSDSSSSDNAATSVAELAVMDSRLSPARVSFALIDNEGDPASVELTYRLAGGAPVDLNLAAGESSLDGLVSSNEGTTHERLWDFEGQLGPGFEDDLTVTVTVLGVAGVQQAVPVGVGNDAPEITNLVVPRGEVTGIAVLQMEVSDSSSDLVQVVLEYDVVGDEPDLGFQVATAAGTGSGTVAATPGGTPHTFFWDVRGDLGFAEELIDLRLFGNDGDLTSDVVTSPIAIDNNGAPLAVLDITNFGNNPDRQRGVPLGFQIFDGDVDTGEPADDVQLVFQWGDPNGSFPSLPTTVAGIEAALADPELREELQIATELPLVYEGLAYPGASAPGEADTVRVPELLTTAFSALRMDPDTRTPSLDGELEILRGHRTPAPLPSLAGLFRSPIGSVPRPGSDHVLVLEATGGGWRLREVDLARGQFVGLDVSGTAAGTTTAMALEGSDGSVLVASDNGGAWHVQRAGPGGVSELISDDGSTVSGTVRGIVALGTEAAILSVGNSLLRLSYPPGETPSAHPLAIADGALQAPWGLAFDRDRDLLYVAEHGADRLLEIHLPTLRRRVLAAPGPGLPAPEAIALENGNSRLLVVTDANPADGVRELRALDLADPGDLDGDGLADAEVFELLPGPALDEGLTGSVGGIASGPEGLRLVTLTSANDVLVGGGVEQTRTITGYEHATQTVRVSPDFDPPFEAGQPARPWRLAWRAEGRYRAAPEGAAGTFLWDCRDTAWPHVQFRIVPIDSDIGLQSSTTQPRTVFPYFGGETRTLGSQAQTHRPKVVRVADLDGDGDKDVVSANYQASGGVTIFFQTSPGEFTAGPLLGSSADHWRIGELEAVDLDGDEDLDLVVESFQSDSEGAADPRGVMAFFQSTPGVFDAPTQLSAVAREVAVADFNGDGDTDVAVQNLEPPLTLDLLLQGPAGDFTTRLVLDELELAGEVGDLEAQDVDGDGDVDLWFCYAGELHAYEQTGPAQFALRPPISPVPAQGRLSTADVDLDGDVDMVLHDAGSLGVLLQTAPWTFEPGPRIALDDVEDQAGPLAFADLDRDGDLDLVLGHGGDTIASGSLAVLLQDSTGEFEVVAKRDPQAGVPSDIVVDDVDGDGVLDLVSANDWISNLSVHFGSAHPNFALGTTLGDMQAAAPLRDADQGDLDGDGDLDLVSSSASGSQLNVFHQTGPGVYVESQIALTVNGADDLRVADLDGDGDLDLVCNVAGAFLILLKEPSGLFLEQPLVVLPGVVSVPHFELEDMDGDGLLDLIPVCELGDTPTSFSSAAILHQDAPGVFGGLQHLGQVASTGVETLAVADLDADGDLDVVLPNPPEGTLRPFLQTGPRQYAPAPDLPSATPGLQPSLVFAADFDGNGAFDLLGGGAAATGAGLDLTLLSRDGALAPPRVASSFEAAGVPSLTDVGIADIDADGDLDFAVSVTDQSSDSGVSIHVQRRPGVFEQQPTLGTGLGATPTFTSLADFDSDGDVDMAFNSSLQAFIAIYFGSH